ncbi:response regulator transcription factor [Actinacidiphila sp. bgisy144]|uniref:response regulator transcription factor n=1 Tax=unclassified Actinacidiphila TaxID=2995708 RepID=UPI003EBDDEDD
MHVLAVSRDEGLVFGIAEDLREQGYEVETGHESGVVLERCDDVDAVFLDVLLADVDGFYVCQEVRAVSHVPVIMISTRNDELDRVLSFRLGADDYIVYPCSARELTARVEAASRRALALWEPRARTAVPSRRMRPNNQVHQIGYVRVDLRRRRIAVHDREVQVTRKEFDLLAVLVSDPERVFTRAHLMTAVWGHDGAGDTRTLGVHIAGLRKKLGVPELIETVRGVGFRLAPPRSRSAGGERAS